MPEESIVLEDTEVFVASVSLIGTAEERSIDSRDMLIKIPSKYAVSLAEIKEERLWHYLRQQVQLDQKGYDEKDNKKDDLIYLS
jgi:hypothetical protein